MKLLASDYDGTLNAFIYDLRFNLAFIREFMQKGNIFVLNTGRPYESIKREISKYQIPYNYLACNDGNLLLDDKNNTIYCTDIANKLDSLLAFKEKFPQIEILPFTYQDHILEYEIISPIMNEEFMRNLEQICLSSNLYYKVFRILNKRFIYISLVGVSKSSAIDKISTIENVVLDDIYTIGDHLNDLEMIRDFHGYTLPWGKKQIKEVSEGVCFSVAGLIKKITR